MTGRLLGLVFPSIVLAFVLTTDSISQENKAASLHPLPGDGVADPARKTGFFPNTSGGVDALDLGTGKVLWSSKEANRPLVASENRLFAQKGNGNQLRVVALDTAKEGKRVFESPPLPLPGWASVEPAYGRRFASSVRLDKNGLFLTWEARAFYAGGAPPPPQVLKAAQMDASGVVQIDVDSGKIEALDGDKIAAGKFFPMASEPANPKVGTVTLVVMDGPAKNAKNPFQQRRTLQALNEAKEVVWQYDIAAPIFLPPRP